MKYIKKISIPLLLSLVILLMVGVYIFIGTNLSENKLNEYEDVPWVTDQMKEMIPIQNKIKSMSDQIIDVVVAYISTNGYYDGVSVHIKTIGGKDVSSKVQVKIRELIKVSKDVFEMDTIKKVEITCSTN